MYLYTSYKVGNNLPVRNRGEITPLKCGEQKTAVKPIYSRLFPIITGSGAHLAARSRYVWQGFLTSPIQVSSDGIGPKKTKNQLGRYKKTPYNRGYMSYIYIYVHIYRY